MNKPTNTMTTISAPALVATMEQRDKKKAHKPSTKAKAAKSADKSQEKTGPLLFIPTTEQAAMIVDGLSGSSEWEALKAAIKSIISNASDLTILSANLSTTLCPVLQALSINGEWFKRESRLGVTAAKAKQNRAASKLAAFLQSNLTRKDAALFRSTSWEAGHIAVMDSATAPAKMPKALADKGHSAQAYMAALKSAKAATAKAATDKTTDKATDKATDKPTAKPTAKAVPVVPTMAPPTTGKTTDGCMMAIDAIKAAIVDGTANRIDITVWESLADVIAAQIVNQAKATAKAAIVAKAQDKATAKAATAKATAKAKAKAA